MSFYEALTKLEIKAEALGMKDPMGDPYEPTEVLAWAAHHHGPVWLECDRALQRGEITVEVWTDALCQLIDEFARDRQRIRIERRLANLAADQRELA